MEDYAPPPGVTPTGVYYDLAVKDWRFTLWAENWPAIQLFSRLSTQWRVGPAGVVGIDYNVLFHELDRRNLPPDQYDEMVAAFGVIEAAALDLLSKKS